MGFAAFKYGAALGAALMLLSAAPTASAEVPAPLTAEESAELQRGGTVIRHQTIETDDRRYVGGLTYTVLETTPAELFAILQDVNAYRRLMPKTKSARRVSAPPGTPARAEEFFVELRQGSSFYEATYTLRARRDPSGSTVRFWMDPTRPHAIDDAWGFFRVEPIASATPNGPPRTLLTYGVLVDMGPGILRELFEEKLRKAMLSVPDRLRTYLAELHARQPGQPARASLR